MSHTFSKLALASLLILPLGTVGCSKGQSPTEPAVDLESAVVSAGSSTASVTEESRGRGRGGDDAAGDGRRGRRGRGSDDAAGDDRGGRRGRGGDDDAGDDRGRRGRRGRGGDDANNNNGGGRGGRNGGNGEQRPRVGQEFEARVVSVDVGGGRLTLAGGTTVIVNGQTQWSARGDLLSLTEIAGSVRSGDPTRVEGRGTRQGDGSILALTLKAEVDN